MKAQSAEMPPQVEDLGRKKRFNFNIQEKTTEDGTVFEFECVVSAANRSALIAALIRREYTPDDELALINNYQDNEPSHVDEYHSYQSFRNECKTIANQFFPA
jgi:hypothetical protein